MKKALVISSFTGMLSLLATSNALAFTEKDFYWEKEMIPHKKVIIDGVNMLHQKNPKCRDIDPGTADISRSKGTKADPMFFVYCGKGAEQAPVFFSKSDVAKKSASIGAVRYMDQTTATSMCEQSAKASATHPSSVKFSRIMGLGVQRFPNGRLAIHSTFKAKNSFGLEGKYRIRCLFSDKELIETEIHEDGR